MSRRTLLFLEAKMFLRQPSYVAAVVCLLLLTFWACSSGLAAMRERQRTAVALEIEQHTSLRRALDVAKQADRGALNLGQFRDPRDVSNFVRIVLNAPAIKPVKVAEVLSPLSGKDAPWYYNLNLGPVAKSLTTYEYTNPETIKRAGFDLNMLLVSFMPLFLIVAGFNVWTADREVDLDRLVRLGRNTVESVYARRLALRLVPLCCIYLSSGATALLLADAANFTVAGRLTAVLVFTAITLFYFAFWWLCIFGVVRANRSASAALASLLLIWLILVILVPTMAQWHARTVYPQVSRSALLDEARHHADYLAKTAKAVQASYLIRHPELHLTQDALKQAPSGAIALITAETNDDLSARQEDAVNTVLMRQETVVRLWSALSPALLTQEALNGLAGKTMAQQIAFKQQVRRYVSDLRDYYRPLLAWPTEKIASGVERYSSYPRFAFSDRLR